MTVLLLLIPAALAIGLVGLAAFFWALRDGQFDDPEGNAARILIEDDECPSQASFSPLPLCYPPCPHPRNARHNHRPQARWQSRFATVAAWLCRSTALRRRPRRRRAAAPKAAEPAVSASGLTEGDDLRTGSMAA